MQALRPSLPCLAAFLTLVGLHSATAAGPEAQRIVGRQAVAALPDPLKAFFNNRIDGLLERALEPGTIWLREAKFRGRAEWSYCKLDAAATGSSADDRLRAARDFPHLRPAARKLFREQNIPEGGLLPWELQGLVEQLAQAFTAGQPDGVVEAAGHVVYFCAQAADPFQTTRNNRGQETGNLVLGDPAPGDRFFAHQDAAHRIGTELIRRNAQRYGGKIEIGRVEAQRPNHAVEGTFAVMLEALADLDELCLADREVLERMAVTDGDGLLSRTDEYYQLLDERCGDRCGDMLRRGASLAAALITGAWQQAGSPRLDAAGPAPTSDPPAVAAGKGPAPTPRPAASGATSYVASKNSKVYHRSDCAHAARISPENRVEFASRQEAEASGRRPCRVCHPDKD